MSPLGILVLGIIGYYVLNPDAGGATTKTTTTKTKAKGSKPAVKKMTAATKQKRRAM